MDENNEGIDKVVKETYPGEFKAKLDLVEYEECGEDGNLNYNYHLGSILQAASILGGVSGMVADDCTFIKGVILCTIATGVYTLGSYMKKKVKEHIDNKKYQLLKRDILKELKGK
ncbi:hypothetical protein KY332_01380 [Candidatus Woesearchaeota archaeon]|nr:hypothetical protein [Candidatus Woesearchaeota archaeon]